MSADGFDEDITPPRRDPRTGAERLADVERFVLGQRKWLKVIGGIAAASAMTIAGVIYNAGGAAERQRALERNVERLERMIDHEREMRFNSAIQKGQP